MSRSHLGESWNNTSLALAQLGRFEAAAAAARAAVEHQTAALKQSPQTIEFRKELGRAYVNLSVSALALRQPKEAATAAREVRRLGTQDAEDLYKAARLLASCGDETEALVALHQSVAAGLRDARRLAGETAFAPSPHTEFQAAVRGVMDRDFPADPFR